MLTLFLTVIYIKDYVQQKVVLSPQSPSQRQTAVSSRGGGEKSSVTSEGHS